MQREMEDRDRRIAKRALEKHKEALERARQDQMMRDQEEKETLLKEMAEKERVAKLMADKERNEESMRQKNYIYMNCRAHCMYKPLSPNCEYISNDGHNGHARQVLL